MLTGEVGRGKTHLLIGICKTLIFEYGIPTRFVEFSRLLSLLKESYSKGLSDSKIITELVNIDVLAIDELGKGRLTEWEMTIIDEIISRRYNAMKTLIGTSNYAWKIASGTPTPNLAIQAPGLIERPLIDIPVMYAEIKLPCGCTSTLSIAF